MGVEIDGYHIDRKVKADADSEQDLDWTSAADHFPHRRRLPRTYTDTEEPARRLTEVRMYRVAAIDNQAVTKESVWSNDGLRTQSRAPSTARTLRRRPTRPSPTRR